MQNQNSGLPMINGNQNNMQNLNESYNFGNQGGFDAISDDGGFNFNEGSIGGQTGRSKRSINNTQSKTGGKVVM